jgi:acyl-CoA reductase-like NAD-dependent aldehyde dehydrogenase
MTSLTSEGSIYYGGNWVPVDSGERLTLINPATEEPIGSVPNASAGDVDAAVRAAREAFAHSGWAESTPVERGANLHRMADELERTSSERGSFVSSENGTVLSQSVAINGHATVGIMRYYAELAGSVEVEEDRGSSLVRREPTGVAAMIVPWNGPQILTIQKLAPALLMGCAVVIKPAVETSLDIRFIADAAAAAGIPDGVLNIVTGGQETGESLIGHPQIDHVSFTGSTAAGRRVAAACGGSLKSVTLELGGKSAAVVLEDADLDLFAAQMPALCLGNSGQGCFLTTRVIVERSRYEEVCEAIAEKLDVLKVGDPLNPETMFGPLVNPRQRQRVLEYIESGRTEGAKVLSGGGVPSDLDRGYYVEPTVFADVDPRMRVFREEIFGPVLTVTPADSEDDAISLANDSSYGLGGVIYTGDKERGNSVARRLATGTVGINGYSLDPTAPFGGVKDSGLGRELGPEGLDPYFQYKSIYQDSGAFF